MTPSFDLEAAHRYFAANCYNQTWGLMGKADRTPEDERLMVASTQASLYHWLQRPEHTEQHLSIGYWQISRVYAVLGNGTEARRYAEVCQEYSVALTPFYRAFALEALARAEAVSGNRERADEYLAQARKLAEEIEDQEERDLLLPDLDTV